MYSLLEAEIERVADEGMAYRHFAQAGDARVKPLKIDKAKVVAGIHSETTLESCVGGLDKGATARSGSVG